MARIRDAPLPVCLSAARARAMNDIDTEGEDSQAEEEGVEPGAEQDEEEEEVEPGADEEEEEVEPAAPEASSKSSKSR